MDNLLVGLIISAATGLSFLAYRHPKLYIDHLSSKITYALSFTLIAALLYNTGVSLAELKLTPLIKVERLGDIEQVVDIIRIERYIFQGIFVAFFYEIVLSELCSYLISQTSDPDKAVPANDQD